MKRALLLFCSMVFLAQSSAAQSSPGIAADQCHSKPFQRSARAAFQPTAPPASAPIQTLQVPLKMNGRNFEIELITARVSAAYSADVQFQKGAFLHHMLLSTSVAGVRVNHYLGQRPGDRDGATATNSLATGDRPAFFTYPIRIYADAGTDITLVAGVSGEGEVEWTVSGRMVSDACWTS